jgi:HAD superfamily hydrolase (TIGR01509 family)
LPRAIFFDNDGVLVDTENLYFRATAEVLADHGVELTASAFHRLFLVESRGAWHLLDETGLPHEDVEVLRARRNARYEELLQDRDLVVPGVREALARLKGRFRLGIVTSSKRPHFDAIHRETGLLDFFDFVLTREDYAHSKPDPEPYLKAVQTAGVPRERCLVIEDSERGLRSAKGAGLACWVIPNELTTEGDFRTADRVLANIDEAVALLLEEPGA